MAHASEQSPELIPLIQERCRCGRPLVRRTWPDGTQVWRHEDTGSASCGGTRLNGLAVPVNLGAEL